MDIRKEEEKDWKIKWIDKGDGYIDSRVNPYKLNFEESLKFIEHQENRLEREESKKYNEKRDRDTKILAQTQLLFSGVLSIATGLLAIKQLVDWLEQPSKKNPLLVIFFAIMVLVLGVLVWNIVNQLSELDFWKKS